MGENTGSRKALMPKFILMAIICGFLSISAAKSEDIDSLIEQEFHLSLNSAILFSLENNPEVQIFWERYKQSQNFIKEAEANFYPDVNLSIEAGREYRNPSAGLIPQNDDTTNAFTAGISVEQLIFDGFGTFHETARRENLSEAAFWRIQYNVEQVMADTVQYYLDMVRYQRETDVVSILLKDIEETLGYIRSQYEEGLIDKVILDYADSRYAFALSELKRKQASYNDAKSRLEFLVGKLPPNLVLEYPLELNPDKLNLQYYLDVAENTSSIVNASQYEIEAMERQLKVERAKDYPEVNFFFNAEQGHNAGGRIGVQEEVSGMFRVSYNIFDGYQNKYGQKRVNSQISELEIRKEQVLKELTRDLKLAYNQIIASKNTLDTNAQEIESNEALKELNEVKFKSGTINVIELIESTERLKESRVNRYQLLTNLYLGSYNLLIKSNIMDQYFFCETC